MDYFKHIYGKMSAQYESLLESGHSSDVVLLVGGKELCVHKLVLSTRSPVFAAMFSHSSTKEAQENRVEMIDVDVEVVEMFVRYIYTGKVDISDQYAADLLALADMYQLDSLKSICEKQLLSQVIATESVLDLLLFADMYQVTELTSKCLDYITDNVTRVRALDGWKKLRVKPDLLDKIIEHLNLKYSKAIRGYGQRQKERFQYTIPFNITSFDSLIFEEMSGHYESLIESGVRSDVALLVGEKELDVHRLVLSTRSSFFAAKFTSNSTKEGQKIRLKVTDVDVEVLELWLRYIYTGKVDMEQYAKELFVLADEFRVECLKSICLLELLSQISIESVCGLFLFADLYHVTGLYRKCLDYIATNITEVMQQVDWMNIVLETDLLTKVYKHFLLNSTELQLLTQISTEPATCLFSVDMFTVRKLSNECIDNIVDNITHVMASDGWKKFVNGTDLLPELYEHLHKKNSELMNVYDDNYQNRYVESEKKNGSDRDWTFRSDSKFEKYLLKNSKVINWMENGPDVILLAGNKELKAHKFVLSTRSPVFASMFGVKNRVLITDVNVMVLKLLLKYIYTGKVKLLDRDVVELMVAAEKYQLNSLKSICEQQLLSNWNLMVITLKSVSDLTIFADIHLVTELYLKCLDYIANHLTRVMASDGWKRIVLKIDLLAKICERLNLNFSEQLLLFPITSKTVSNLFILADMHQSTKLTSKCIEYITDNVTQVMKEEDWKKIVLRGDLVAKLFEHLSSKYLHKYTKVLDKEIYERDMRFSWEMDEEMDEDCCDYDYDNFDYEFGSTLDFDYFKNWSYNRDHSYDDYYDYYYDHAYAYDYDYDYDNDSYYDFSNDFDYYKYFQSCL